MITFARLFRPAVAVTIAGQPIVALGVPPTVAPRVAFRVRRTLTTSPDTADVTIYGLDASRRLALGQVWAETGRALVSIASGYDGIAASLFVGDARTLKPGVRIGSEYVTSVTADDGGDALADAMIPPGLSSTAGLTAQQMVDVAIACFAAHAAQTGATPITPSPSVAVAIGSATPESTVAFYTSVAVGKARDLLDEAARTLGVRWWVRDSQLFMSRRGLPVEPALAVALPRSHWLDEPVDDANGTVRFSTLLDPNIVPGRQVALIGRVAPGSTEPLRVESCEYVGDTDTAAPFSVSCEGRRIA